MFSTLTLLAWGGIEYEAGYQRIGQLDKLRDAVRWGTDWIIKANPAPNVLYGQVGDGNLDHSYWGPPEVMTMARPSFAITTSKPGSELAAEAAAALASASMLFETSDAAYSTTLLARARQLFDFADRHRGKYTDAIPNAASFYQSYSGYFDELIWASAWLHRATGEAQYLQKAESLFAQNYTGASFRWTHNWDDKIYGAVVLLAQLTGKPLYRETAERWLNFWTVGDGGRRIATTPGGLAWLDQWGSLRYAATTSFLAGLYSDTVNDHGTRYRDFSRRQIDYILGANPSGRSYVVGYGNNPPKNPHHRAAHGSWSNNISLPAVNRHVLFGALVGGPKSASDSDYADNRSDYIANEVATDYNAGFTGALARLVEWHGGSALPGFPPASVAVDDEFFVEAAINQNGGGFTEIRALLNNRSALPPAASDFLSFRYFLDLSEMVAAGYQPGQLRLSTAYNQGARVTGPFAHDPARHIYYVVADFTGTTISPGGSQLFRKEVQFRMSLPQGAPASAWNPANDPSFSGLTTGTPAATPKIPVFQQSELLGGVIP